MLDGRVLGASQVEYKPFGKLPLQREGTVAPRRLERNRTLQPLLLKRHRELEEARAFNNWLGERRQAQEGSGTWTT